MVKIVLMRAGQYFLLVFMAGFVLGVVRELWLIQWLSQRQAELLEMPVMLWVSYMAAKYIVIQQTQQVSAENLLAIGGIALMILLVFELTLVLALRGMRFSDYIESRDVVSGSAYLLSLCIFMLMPWLINRIRSQ